MIIIKSTTLNTLQLYIVEPVVSEKCGETVYHYVAVSRKVPVIIYKLFIGFAIYLLCHWFL